MQSVIDFLNTYSNILIIVIAVLAGLYAKLKWRIFTAPTDGPLLSAGEMLGAGGLVPMNKGTLAGYEYIIMTNGGGRVMVYVQLGFDTGMHVVAYGDKGDVGMAAGPPLSKKWLKRVELEGDFPEYFRLYCTPDREVELLQIFGPDTMAEFADFCQAYNFEIYRETLYISTGSKHDPNDQTSMVTDVEHFLQQNGTVLSRLNPNTKTL